jgi:hypothetical protein
MLLDAVFLAVLHVDDRIILMLLDDVHRHGPSLAALKQQWNHGELDSLAEVLSPESTAFDGGLLHLEGAGSGAKSQLLGFD